jgi:hypothetical protein
MSVVQAIEDYSAEVNNMVSRYHRMVQERAAEVKRLRVLLADCQTLLGSLPLARFDSGTQYTIRKMHARLYDIAPRVPHD